MKKTRNSTQENWTEKSESTSASEYDDTVSELYSEGAKGLIKYRKLFNLHDDTVFLAIDILKSFIKKGGELTSETITIITICCLMLACKYNEIYPPKTSEITEVFDYFDSEEEIYEMEGEILMQCEYELPTENNLISLLENRNKREENIKTIYKNISEPQFANINNMKIIEILFPNQSLEIENQEPGLENIKTNSKLCQQIENQTNSLKLSQKDLNIFIN